MRARDGSAVADLASLYGPRIQQLAFRYLKNWEDAEEVAQDVLLKVYRKIEAFRGDAALSSWIYRITFNTAMSRLRTVRSRAVELQPSDLATESIRARPGGTSGLDVAGRRSGHARADAQAADWSARILPEVYRVPVLLRDIHGLSTEEASAILKVKPQTLKSRLHRGRLILRKHLGDFAGGLELHAGRRSTELDSHVQSRNHKNRSLGVGSCGLDGLGVVSAPDRARSRSRTRSARGG